jgi:hypothetical protein
MTAVSSWKERRIESAATDVVNARDSAGLCVQLCNPMDVDSVREAICRMGKWFGPHRAFISTDGEYAAIRNLGKLAALLEAHLS